MYTYIYQHIPTYTYIHTYIHRSTNCPCAPESGTCQTEGKKCSFTPKEVIGLSPAERVLEISGGEGHTFVLTSRFLYAAGDNTMRQLGVRSCVPGVANVLLMCC